MKSVDILFYGGVLVGAFNVEMHRERKNDRTINCKYDPREPGDYQIEVIITDSYYRTTCEEFTGESLFEGGLSTT